MMESNQSIEPTSSFFDSLLPHLNAERRKGVESLKNILSLFPGQAPAEVEKSIRAILAATTTSVASMIERAKQLVSGGAVAAPDQAGKPSDTIETFLKDAKKLTAGDLKAIAGGISLPVPGQKGAIVAELKQWLDSKGTYAPKSALEKKKERARELAGDLPQRLSQMTPELADEIVRRSEAASKDKELGTEGFVEFASLLLGTPMKGSKPSLLKQIKAFVDRLAVSHAQTSSF